MKKYYAEAIGTYMMVFCGTGAIIINQEMNGVITHPGIAATFGLIVAAVIYALGDVSGAHINPAVTIAFALRKVFPVKEILPYILSQSVGAVLASLSLHLLFPLNEHLGGTSPTGSVMQSFVLEILLTLDVRHPSRFTGQQRAGHHGRNGDWCGGVIGSTLRRTYFRSVDESCSIFRSCHHFGRVSIFVDICFSTHYW